MQNLQGPGLGESFQVYRSYNFEEVFIFLSEFSP